MAYEIGEVQAAIWRTEEAIELQRMCVMSAIDVQLREVASRSLSTLEDLLMLQQGMLDILMRSEAIANSRPLSAPGSSGLHTVPAAS